MNWVFYCNQESLGIYHNFTWKVKKNFVEVDSNVIGGNKIEEIQK